MKPSIDQLRSFVRLAETPHFTQAANGLGMSQSGLSTTVRKLEAAVGTPLFDRHTRSVRLTASGAAFLPAARRLIREWDSVFREAENLALTGGQVSIAAPNAQCALFLPPLIRKLKNRYPDVRVVVHDVPEHEVHAMVRSGDVELGVATETNAKLDLRASAFYTDNYVAAIHPEHALARKRTLEWSQVCKQPIIGPLADNPVRKHVDEQLEQAGLRLTYAYEVSLPWTMVGLVREGLGIAVLTTALRPLMDWHKLVTKNIGRPLLSRNLVVLRQPKRALSSAAVAFEKLLLGRNL